MEKDDHLIIIYLAEEFELPHVFLCTLRAVVISLF